MKMIPWWFTSINNDDSDCHIWLPIERCIEMIFSQKIVDSLSIIALLAYYTKIYKS